MCSTKKQLMLLWQLEEKQYNLFTMKKILFTRCTTSCKILTVLSFFRSCIVAPDSNTKVTDVLKKKVLKMAQLGFVLTKEEDIGKSILQNDSVQFCCAAVGNVLFCIRSFRSRR
jgi:hypothetical protein